MIEDTTCSNSGELTQMGSYISVPASSYENLLLAYHVAETVAEIIIDEWKNAADNGYGGPSESMKTILRLYNPGAYMACVEYQKRAQKEAEKKFKEKLEKETLNPGPIYPYNPYPADAPAYPYKGIEITCESGEEK